jgi:outer membrane receptor protein involved in Fe transport
VTDAPADATFDTFNPRFNLAFKASDDLLFYGNIAKGFRSGSFQTEAQAAAASAALGVTVPSDIQPDIVWSYEVGAKGKVVNGLITFDVALYTIDWTNIQLQTTINGVATLSNGGDARSRGIDVGLVLEPVRGFQLQAIGNINDSEFTSVLPAIVAFNPLAAPGSPIPGVPDSSLNLSASYRWDIAAWDAKASLSAGYVYRAEQLDSSGLESDQLDELNLRAGLEKGGWKLFLFAENLTNNRVALVNGPLGVQPNFPRRIGARFAIDF